MDLILSFRFLCQESVLMLWRKILLPNSKCSSSSVAFTCELCVLQKCRSDCTVQSGKLKTRHYRLIHKRTEDTENLISNFCSIQKENNLNFNKHKFYLVPHIFVNNRVSINLQWIMICSQYGCGGTLVSLAVT